MESGYLFTPEGKAALELFDDDRVRFAASLDDGSGFLAFDGSAPDFQVYGTVHMGEEIFPFFVPKRWHGMGREVYAMVPGLFTEYLKELKAVTGVAKITEAMLLVESDGPISIGADWQAGVVEFKDKRLELVDA